MLELIQLSEHVGAEVRGVDLSRPLDELTLETLNTALADRSLLLFRAQRVADAELVAFGRRFGELEKHVLTQFTLDSHPEVFVLSNKTADGRPIGAHKVGWHWHVDNTYMPQSSLGSLLHALEVPPEGGDTLFASLTAAYEGLCPTVRERVDRLEAVHSYVRMRAIKYPNEPLSEAQQARVPDIAHPLVRVHPVTGRRLLYVGEYIIQDMLGLPHEEAMKLLDELNAHATQDAYVFRHQWAVGDVLFWDNRAVMHKALPYDDTRHRRRMHSVRIRSDGYLGRPLANSGFRSAPQ